MIKQLTLRNFTVFKEAELQFSPGLNVIIGENGTGKTHLLKLAYIFSSASNDMAIAGFVSEQNIEQHFSKRLCNIFKPDKVGNLTTLGSDGKSMVSASVFGSIYTSLFRSREESENPVMSDETVWTFTFSNRSIDKVAIQLQDKFNKNLNYSKGIYLPTKEMISFFEGFYAAYENREFQFDETYRDLALHLSANKLKKPPAFIKQELKTLSADVGGSLKLEGGKFYLVTSGSKAREITLVAEGIRKIATLLHLLENGSLEVGDTLFWDEPESNLNPKLIKDVAAALLFLCQNGIQVIIGTHSLFLLRELEILTSQKAFKAIPQRYFALGTDGDGVAVQQGDAVDDINPFVMLDEELAQSDRFMDAGND